MTEITEPLEIAQINKIKLPTTNLQSLSYAIAAVENNSPIWEKESEIMYMKKSGNGIPISSSNSYTRSLKSLYLAGIITSSITSYPDESNIGAVYYLEVASTISSNYIEAKSFLVFNGNANWIIIHCPDQNSIAINSSKITSTTLVGAIEELADNLEAFTGDENITINNRVVSLNKNLKVEGIEVTPPGGETRYGQIKLGEMTLDRTILLLMKKVDNVTAENYIQNFTNDGLTSSFFTISGNLSTTHGSVTYNNLTLTTALKIETATSISFTITNDATILLVFGGDISAVGKKIKIDNIDCEIDSTQILTKKLLTGTHTITKNDSLNLFYVEVMIKKIGLLGGEILEMSKTFEILSHYNISISSTGGRAISGATTDADKANFLECTYNSIRYYGIKFPSENTKYVYFSGWKIIPSSIEAPSYSSYDDSNISDIVNLTSEADTGTKTVIETVTSSTDIASAISSLPNTGEDGTPHELIFSGTLTKQQIIDLANSLKNSDVQINVDLSNAYVAADITNWNETSGLNHIFNECLSIRKMLLPHNILHIDGNCFSGCVFMREFTFNNEIISFSGNISSYQGMEGFFSSTRVTEITLPNSFVTFGNFAISNSNIKKINIPSGSDIVDIGQDTNNDVFKFDSFKYTNSGIVLNLAQDIYTWLNVTNEYMYWYDNQDYVGISLKNHNQLDSTI